MNIQPIIDLALAEDIGEGDLTSGLLVPPGVVAAIRLVAGQPMVIAGVEAAMQVFRTVDRKVRIETSVSDGQKAGAGDSLLTVAGSARSLLAAERVALNLLQRACGVATLTKAYVDAVAGTGAVILDTRKTMPGLRQLDKYAVTCGGGKNYRMGLYDAVLIKDNHIALLGSVKAAVEKARAGTKKLVIVECDTLEQLREALPAKPDRILLDNMRPSALREAVKLVKGSVPLEASGGVTLANVRQVAETGVNFISVGAITHSAKAADISAEVMVL